MAAVTLEHIGKSFPDKHGDVQAVSDLNLAIADRELLVLVGPSGCGKTTTLRLLAGLDAVTTGTIRIGGKDVTRVAPKNRDVAMVFQDYALYPHMTVYKNLAFGLKMRGTPKSQIRQQVVEVAQRLGLQELLDRKPGALSGGERQRVAVGRAIIREPQVFLFDEPLSNLDARLRLSMRAEIKTLQRTTKTTMIYVTHDQEEAMTLGDRLAVMNQGVLLQCAKPLEIYDRPVNRFVAEFVGSPAMNFLHGRLKRDGDATLFDGNLGRLALPAYIAKSCAAHYGQGIGGEGIVLGIRPEHLTLLKGQRRFTMIPPISDDPAYDSTRAGETRGDVPDAMGDSARAQAHGPVWWEAPIEVSVRHVEPLGACAYVHLAAATGERIVVRTSATISISPGDRVTLGIDLSRVHLFVDDDQGARIA